MPDPVHIGWVKFGARNGCPCGPGEKAITYVKFHNGSYPFPFDSRGHIVYLAMDQSGPLWEAADLPHDLWHMRGFPPRYRGPMAFDRRTGLSDGGNINILTYEAGTPTIPVTLATDTLVKFHFHADGYGVDLDGEMVQTYPYTAGMLRDDLAAIIESPETSLALVPSGQSAFAGMREANPRGIFHDGWLDAAKQAWVSLFHRQWPWSGVDWIDLGICDGAIKLFRRSPFRWSNLGWDMTVESVLSWTYYMSMQRVQSPIMGYISTQETWRALRNGEDSMTKPWGVGAKQYWHVDKGPFRITSPWITDADADSTDAVFQRRIRVTPNDRPPDGVRALPWGQYGTASEAMAC